MDADVQNYINKLAAARDSVSNAPLVIAENVSTDDRMVEKLASAVEYILEKTAAFPPEGEGKPIKKDEDEKSGKGGSLQDVLKKKILAAKKEKKAPQGKTEGAEKEKKEDGNKEDKESGDASDQDQEKEASDVSTNLQSTLADVIKEKVAGNRAEESSFINGILARMSLGQNESVADTQAATTETKSPEVELAKSASEDNIEGTKSLTLAGLVGEGNKETTTPVESASSDVTKTAASLVSSDLSTFLRDSILSKVGRTGA